MFKHGKKRTVRNEVFTGLVFARLSFEARWFLLALLSHADDDGNVDLDMKAFSKLVALSWEPTSIATMDSWIEELTAQGLLLPYTVDGCAYAAIEGWTDEGAPLYQYTAPKSRGNWRNPTPDQADKEPHVPVRGDSSVRDISKQHKGGGERGSRTSSELSGQLDDARVSARSERGTARPSGGDEGNQGPEARKKVGHRPGSRRKPQEAPDEVTPSPTKQGRIKKPLRPSQPATEAPPKKRVGRPPQKLRESATKERHTTPDWKARVDKLMAEQNRMTGGKRSGSSTTGTTTSTSQCENCLRISCTCTKPMPTRFDARFNR
jgi:hypothetical protein